MLLDTRRSFPVIPTQLRSLRFLRAPAATYPHRESSSRRTELPSSFTLSLKHSRRDEGRTGRSAMRASTSHSSNSTRVELVCTYKSKKTGGEEKKINRRKRERVLMRDSEWARKRRRTVPLLLLFYHSARLNCSSAFGETWQFDDEVAAAPREALKRELAARARVHVTYTHAHNTHTPASPSRYLCAQCLLVTWVSLSLRVSSVRAREREKERERAFYRPFLSAKRSVPRYQCAKQRSRVPLRDWNAG